MQISWLSIQQIQTNFVVVISPGSQTLRIGRATDTLPLTLPHVIARRHKQPGQMRYEDAWLIREGLNVSLKHFLFQTYHLQLTEEITALGANDLICAI